MSLTTYMYLSKYNNALKQCNKNSQLETVGITKKVEKAVVNLEDHMYMYPSLITVSKRLFFPDKG